ncbi:transcription factor IIA subunit alpha [Orbilia oligospora]|nr:transcription factor IIA subunit alpha [Orbilia oligospora]KAF3247244.1 transcription factor IIA subunit alpha [Orbilia oligospora]KAF3262786.1 transcription factor IIA subunit alpha [Orbilia oligospora]KAF3284524.1 transcription factor IIA subunit alpha [Orbilia oligospora]
MTNITVGKVYEKVIQQVIDSSVTDVQDSGIDPSVLEELKKVWQEKLSGFKVATFPWDPEPVPEPAAKQETVDTGGDLASDGTRIKPDPEAEMPPAPAPAPLGQALSDPSLAAARAREMVAQKFGGNAQQRSTFPGLMLPTPPQQQHHNGQTDGPDDGPTRQEVDEQIQQIVLEGEQIRTYEDAIAEALRQFNIQTDILQIRPLKKKKGKGAISHKTVDTDLTLSPVPDAVAGPSSLASFKPLQTDGPEMDEDAINSDLDDTDEEPVDDDDDGEGISQIMLCMYDKVQRTKNKWKCWLRNGVLTVNGKEYVFGKATGEYEW